MCIVFSTRSNAEHHGIVNPIRCRVNNNKRPFFVDLELLPVCSLRQASTVLVRPCASGKAPCCCCPSFARYALIVCTPSTHCAYIHTTSGLACSGRYRTASLHCCNPPTPIVIIHLAFPAARSAPFLLSDLDLVTPIAPSIGVLFRFHPHLSAVAALPSPPERPTEQHSAARFSQRTRTSAHRCCLDRTPVRKLLHNLATGR